MMHQIRISDNNLEAFAPLIPSVLLSQLRSGTLAGVGGVDAYDGQPMAVLLCRETHHWMELVWLAVAEEYQNMGNGQELVDAQLLRVRDQHFWGAFADLPKEAPAEALHQLLKRCGFQFREVERKLYTLPLGELTSIQLLRSKHFDGVKSLGKTTALERKMLLAAAAQGHKAVPLPKPLDWSSYEPSISVLGKDGLLLVEAQGKELIFSCVWSQNAATLRQMVAYALEQAERAYPPETAVTFQSVAENVDRLIEKLLPQCRALSITQAYREFTRRGRS